MDIRWSCKSPTTAALSRSSAWSRLLVPISRPGTIWASRPRSRVEIIYLHDISHSDIIGRMSAEPSPSPVEFEILLSLAAGQLHGYGIMQQVGSRSGGSMRLG